MKKFIAIIIGMLCLPFMLFSQQVDLIIDDQSLASFYVSLLSLPPLVLLITEWIKKQIKVTGGLAQLISWLVSIILAFVGWGLNLGIFADISNWYIVLAYGVGIGLATNGVFDIQIIQVILKKIFPEGKSR